MKFFTFLTLVALLLLSMALSACNVWQPPAVPAAPLESFVDPALTTEDQDRMLRALAVINPESRSNVTFLTQDSRTIYGSSIQARQAGEVLQPLEGSNGHIFQASDGSLTSFPDLEETSGELRAQSYDTLSACPSAKSGPYRRITHVPGTAATPINWMRATVRLPRGSGPDAEAGNYKQRILNKDNKQLDVFTNGPFIYAGGEGANDGTAVDAGFQLSTGGVTDKVLKTWGASDGNWSLFINSPVTF
jgi:hypothetical protein